MTAEQWKTGRRKARLTQIQAARALGISQPYLSQLETGDREAAPGLARRAVRLYRLAPTALPLAEDPDVRKMRPEDLERKLAALGYPGFSHVRVSARGNPTEVVLGALCQSDLDPRLVEALPWVLMSFSDLNWPWLRDHAKLSNIQNRLGYVVQLARQVAASRPGGARSVQTLSCWEEELEAARLVREGTLCRDSMPAAERNWLRSHRPAAAAHWNLLTSLAPQQLPYAAC